MRVEGHLMAREKSPAEEHTREEPLVIWTDDNAKLEVFAESGGVSMGSPARISNPQWIVRARGVEYAGWGEATIYDTERDILVKAAKWWDAKRETL